MKRNEENETKRNEENEKEINFKKRISLIKLFSGM